MNLAEKRFFVKIEAGPQAGGNPCVYFNRDFPFETFMKWKWYFDYRAAMHKVKNPRHRVDLLTGSYNYVAPFESQVRTLKNKITGKKRIISKFENQIRLVKNNWNELFPIDDLPDYQKAIAKIDKTKKELYNLEISLTKTINNHDLQTENSGTY